MRHGTGMRGLALAISLLLVVGITAACAGTEDATTDELQRSVGGVAPEASPVGTDAATEELTAEDTVAQTAPTSDGTTPGADRMVIRSQTLRLEVESTQETVDNLRALADTHGGAITALQVATDTEDWVYRYDEYGSAVGDGAALRGWMTVRVPADSLDAFVDEAMALGTVKYQVENTDDVTQQHVDLTARLENLRAEEARLRSFFDAAVDVQDMLAIEAELNRVRQEIESLDAQITYLERQAAMATVTLELTEDQPVVRPEGETWGFTEAITAGFRGAALVINILIMALIAVTPLALIALAAFFIIRAILKRRAVKRLADANTPDTPAPSENTEA